MGAVSNVIELNIVQQIRDYIKPRFPLHNSGDTVYS